MLDIFSGCLLIFQQLCTHTHTQKERTQMQYPLFQRPPKNQITDWSSNSPIKHPHAANSFLIHPPKSQLSACPLYTNDSDDSSLPNTDTSLLSPWWGVREGSRGQADEGRFAATPGEDVMIF